MKQVVHLALLLMAVSYAAAQNDRTDPVQVRKLYVLREGNDVRIELSLSASTVPSVETATNPDRIVLILPNTVSDAKQQRVPINLNGVQTIRIGLNSPNPPVTRVVLDLDSAHPYELATQGNKVILKVQSSQSASARTRERRDGPPPAASGSLVGGIFHRPPQHTAEANSEPATAIPPAPTRPPINISGDQAANGSNADGTVSASASTPSAAHPSKGSLREGTVFPGMGTPGNGNVPGGNVNKSGFDQKASASQAGTTQPPAAAAQSAPAPVVPPNTTASAGSVAGNSISSTGFDRAASVGSQPTSPTSSSSPNAPAPVVPPTTALSVGNVPGGSVNSTGLAQTANAGSQPTSPTLSSSQNGNGTVVAQANTVSAANQATASSVGALVPSDHQPVPQQTVSATAPPPSPTGSVPQGQFSSVESSPGSARQPVVKTTAEADIPVLALRAVNPDFRTVFKVKYVAQGAAYLDGGRNSGLAEGMKLIVRESTAAPPSSDPNNTGLVAELEVTSVAESSAVTEIHNPTRDVKAGDQARLSGEDQEALVQKNTLSATRKYPTVVSFSEGDTLDEEARAEVPKPPLPSINRARGRFGFDYMGTMFHGSPGIRTSDLGMVARADITRIGGTYWNLSGYWRGRINSTSGTSTQTTLQDLINRTYHLSMTYDNPQSAWVAGFGRMYLPWASSLDTIDGGYFGRRVHPGATLGIFAGSTPDPTSWDYNPNRRLGGAFINFDGGSYDSFKYSSTTGMGVSTIGWKVDRPFIFAENSFSFKRFLSIYSSLQADSPAGNAVVQAPGAGIGRSFTTVRVQPFSRLEIDFNHTYFRDVPTFDPALISTTLLDKYLFQGFSVGGRVEVIKQIWVYTTQGQSNRSGDPKNTLNQAYGVTFGHLPWVGLHADLHYSRFSGSFGNGLYRAVSLSRNIGENFHVELLGGDQNFSSAFSANNRTRFLMGNAEVPVGRHFFLQGGYTIDRGATQDYDQWMFTLGYRFDTKYNKK